MPLGGVPLDQKEKIGRSESKLGAARYFLADISDHASQSQEFQARWGVLAFCVFKVSDFVGQPDVFELNRIACVDSSAFPKGVAGSHGGYSDQVGVVYKSLE